MSRADGYPKEITFEDRSGRTTDTSSLQTLVGNVQSTRQSRDEGCGRDLSCCGAVDSGDTSTELHAGISSEGSEPEEGWCVVRGRGGRIVKSLTVSAPPGPQVAPDEGARQASRNSFEPLVALGESEDTPTDDRGGWSRRPRRKGFGSVRGHARFIQHFFRRSTAIKPGCWSAGGLRGVHVFRVPTVFACQGGLNNAGEGEFEAQRERSEQVLLWYENYVRLHRRLHSFVTPSALVTFCCEGGASEGVRRAGGAAHGQDVRDQPKYRRRFGAETFSMGDSRSPHEMRRLRRRVRSFVTLASPPCKAHSSARMRGEASEPPMIAQTRQALLELGGLYSIENVVGARGELRDAPLLRGAFFGLHVDRPRLFENNFGLHVDRALSEGGNELRKHTCLGFRRRWRRLDHFGRPEMRDCCSGNLWSVQGDKPLRCTECECADAMGMDRDHMSYEGMSQAIPPVYSRLVFAQACMRSVEREFGIEAITFDEMEADPGRARRLMAHWIEGAGGASPSQGVEFAKPIAAADARAEIAPAGAPRVEPSRVSGTPSFSPVHVGRHAGGEIETADELTVRAAELRELEYSWAGGYDRAVVGRSDWQSAADLDWDAPAAGTRREQLLVGGNTLVSTSEEQSRGLAQEAARRAADGSGTRVTIEARGARMEHYLSGLGFRLLRRVRRGRAEYATATTTARAMAQCSFWTIGEVVEEGGRAVDYEHLSQFMDPLDRPGAVTEPKSAKAARSYEPIPVEPSRWDIGLPDELDEMMRRGGVGIHVWDEPGFSEVPFYPFKSPVGLVKSIQEADRALAAGAMEYVPAEHVAEVRQFSTISPWTIVDQGGGKWRLCHDYSVGTNRVVATAPFTLPSVWDVAPAVKPGSFFAKYDIRDGFWHCPVGVSSRKRLVVRHPGTGRLMWASRLPFGYLDSPRLFCGLTEAIIGRLRERAAGLDIQFYVFVDDVLAVGGSEELTRRAMEMIEEEFAERGVIWAPHKRRGPCQCIEFLGLLLANTEGWRGITITQSRRDKLLAEIEAWLAREPEAGVLEADPKAVASLLGKLVFSSQVVDGGRTYMQGMLAAFQGLVIDWRRGTVKFDGRPGQSLTIGDAFWRDLRWWSRHLEGHSFAEFSAEAGPAHLVLAGTDASDWGTGQIIWPGDGGREEHVLIFSAAEKRRSINWRELLGIVRVCRLGGERLRGKTVLIESDNMAAVGATRKMASKAADMQELVRRLYRLSKRHGFSVRITHTPGEKLDRPDQTSRGDAAEEPRVRLNRALFERISRRFGPFSSYIGAEREHAVGKAAEGAQPSLWVHPTFNTVGSALRLVGNRLGGGGSNRTSAVVLVPDAPGAQWSSMLKHGLVVGRWSPGDEGLEANVLGKWRPCTFKRPTLAVLLPRAAGFTPRRCALSHRESIEQTPEGEVAGAGYVLASDGRSVRLEVMPGSFVYSMPREGQPFGELNRVCEPTATERRAAPGGVGPWAQEARRGVTKVARSAAAKAGAGWVACEVETKSVNYLLHPADYWTVDGFVKHVGGGKTFDRFVFDVQGAHASIEALIASGPGVDTNGWDMFESAMSETPLAGSRGEGQPTPVSGYADYVHVPSPDPAWLDEATQALDGLSLSINSVNRGPEGAIREELPRARGGEVQGDTTGSVVQPCQYEGIACRGCGGSFRFGEGMLSHGDGFTHQAMMCVKLGDARGQAAGSQGGSSATRFFGLYSDEVGASGVYTDRAAAEYWMQGSHESKHARLQECKSEEDAKTFIRRCTHERAVASLKAPLPAEGGVAGSSTRRVHLAEKLAPSRIEQIERCINGQCGHQHGPDVSTACRKGCGRFLHVATCAEMGKGYAALGNFTCPDCRMEEALMPGVEGTEQLRALVTRTMVLELGQGRETTAASYSSYTTLEEEFVRSQGMELGAGLLLPRHSGATFKNFISWLALDRDRARSIESVMRAAGSFLTKLELLDVTKNKSVQAHLKEVLEQCGQEHEPQTAATARMLKAMVRDGGVIDRRYPHDGVVKFRTKLQSVCEGVGGCRVSEVAGGGDCHGLLANHSAILRDPVSGEEVVELKLEHSKTGYARYLDLAGTTATSQIECAKYTREYWREAGMLTTKSMQAGIEVERPDFWVVRVSLLGCGAEPSKLLRLERAIRVSKVPGVKRAEKATLQKARERAKIASVGVQEKRYVNIMSGRREWPDMQRAADEMRAHGFEARITPGPLLLATTGGKWGKVTSMPLTIGAASDPLKGLLELAEAEANSDKANPDPDLDVESGRLARWASHSLRRLANTTARRYAAITGTSEDEIDAYMGWHEKDMHENMQRHYEAMDIRARMKQAKITGQL